MWEDVQSLVTPIAAQSRYVGARPGAANVIDAAMAGAFFNVALGAFHEAAAYVRSEDVAITRRCATVCTCGPTNFSNSFTKHSKRSNPESTRPIRQP